MSDYPAYSAEPFPSRAEQQACPVKDVLTIASGALMLFPIMRKRSSWRWTAAVAGGALIYRGIAGWGETSCSHKRAYTAEHLAETTTIGKSLEELFSLWRNPEVLARVMHPFGEVTILGPDRLRWKVNTPLGSVESEADLVEARAPELVHWQTRPGSGLQVDEYMRFRPAPGGTGTEATLTYDIDFSHVPAGPVLQSIVSFLEQAPRNAIQKILHNFKSIAETGATAS